MAAAVESATSNGQTSSCAAASGRGIASAIASARLVNITSVRTGPRAGPRPRARACWPRARRSPRAPPCGGSSRAGSGRTTGSQGDLPPASTAVVLETHRPGEQVDRLVLLAVVLQAERVARRDVKNFSYILLGMRPDELVSPGFLDPPRRVAHIIRHDFRCLGHAPEGSHGALQRQPARQRTCGRVILTKTSAARARPCKGGSPGAG